MGRRYVTTAIPYVNADPHLGFALELVQADVLARHGRLRGLPVRFLTGTDDNALKNVTAARAAGQPVRSFVDANAQRFAALRDPLQLSFDDFIRTSADPRHRLGVERLWQLCASRGDFYQRSYQGWYCTGCEQFYAPSELVTGRCAEHGIEPEQVRETNWFFRLACYQQQLLEVIETDRVQIRPAQRRNEVLAFLRAGLDDISVSRPAARSGGWGVPVPGDPDQVIYVWWDALGNYVTALGFGSDDSAYHEWWCDSAERIHLIGKGVVRFHAVYWLALLLSAGQPLPTKILVHDYLTIAGAKLSKSAGSRAHPAELAARFGADAVRWWLLSDVAQLGDTDFTVERLVDRADSDLANGIGNLTRRVLSIAHKYRGALPVHVPATGPLLGQASELPGKIDAALATGDFRAATLALRDVVSAGNRFIEAHRPWQLYRDEQAGNVGAAQQLDTILAELAEVCRIAVREFAPFLPDGAQRLHDQLARGTLGDPIFARLCTRSDPPLR